MDATRRDKGATSGFGYAAVEAALARVFERITPAERGSLRGKLQHFRRLRFGPSGRPGPGLPISYSQEDVDRWLLALQLEEFLFDPVQAVELIKRHWGAAEPKRKSIPINLRETLSYQIGAARAAADREHILVLIAFWRKGSPTIGFADGTVKASNMIFAGGDQDPRPVGVTFFDLTARLKKLDEALDEAQKPKPKPKLTDFAKQIVNMGRRLRGEEEIP
jgi:hypothetical protein